MDDFEKLFEENFHAIYHYVYYMVGNRADAEDIAQEVFMKVERTFPESLYINQEVKVSPNQKLAAFRIHAYPLEGAAKEYLFVLDLDTGKEVIEPIVKDFFNSYEFESDSTLKVDDQKIPLK